MTVSEINIAEKLSQFIKEYADDHCCLELLRFFGGHPNTRFSRLVVVHALNSNPGKLYTKRALRRLADKGVVRTYIENNVPLYSLTEDESLCSLASDLAKLDWCQWQLVLQQLDLTVAAQSNPTTQHAKASETLS